MNQQWCRCGDPKSVHTNGRCDGCDCRTFRRTNLELHHEPETRVVNVIPIQGIQWKVYADVR